MSVALIQLYKNFIESVQQYEDRLYTLESTFLVMLAACALTILGTIVGLIVLNPKLSFIKKFKQRESQLSFGQRGLANLGHTCYFNSALQCLLKTQELYLACEKSQYGRNGKLKAAYIHFCQKMFRKDAQSGPERPTQLHRLMASYNPMFGDFRQHDSGEALGTLLYMLHDQMNEVLKRELYKISDDLRRDEKHSQQLLEESVKKDHKREKSIVDDIIYGRYKIVYQCLKDGCGEKYILFEKFHAVILPVPSNQTKLTLENCFQAFTQPSYMTGQNKWYCDRCQCEQDTNKFMSIQQTNQILFVILKRFTEKAKINSRVDVPLEIDSKYMKSSEEGYYELYGMIIQSGSLHGGHYIAVCWDSINGWMILDDSRTELISADRAKEMARDAYILAYRRKTVLGE